MTNHLQRIDYLVATKMTKISRKILHDWRFKFFHPLPQLTTQQLISLDKAGKNTHAHVSLISNQTWGQLHFEVINYYYY